MPDILTLTPAEHLTHGVQRDIYLHPQDETQLVKVLRKWEDMPKRRNFNGIMDRLLPFTRIRQVKKEYAEYQRLIRLHGDSAPLPITHLNGFIPTSVGKGCLTQRVIGTETELGETLRQKVAKGTLTDDDVDLLNDAIARFYRLNIRAGDMNAANFVFGKRYHGRTLGPRECVLVDGFGDIHAIPVRSLGAWANRLGLDDSCKRLAARTGLQWDPKTRQFNLS